MIHTNEPANVFFVYLTAYRSHESQEVNEAMLKGMTREIRKFSGSYGSLQMENVVGCYHEAGAESPSIERTLMVKCHNRAQVGELAVLACKGYFQDAILEVSSQTHTAKLIKYDTTKMVHSEETIGTFTKQDTGSEMYSIINGERWEVA